jgi:predicted P-loop ATPase/GTPase
VHEAGKTTLCKALIHGFKKAGIPLVPFKPHSGISYWNQFKIFQQSQAKGTLLSNDIMELEAVAESHVPPEVLNPVNRLCGPVLNREIPEEKLVFQEFLAERFTFHDGVTHKSIYYLNRTMNLSSLRDMEAFYLKIKRNAEKIHFAHKFRDLEEAYSRNFEKATSTCYKCVQDRDLVVESFNDAAYPFNRAEDCDTVLCVSSNTILQFDASKYFQAVELKGKKTPTLQLTIPQVYTPSLIEHKILLQPLTAEERDDAGKLTENYSEVIKQLLENT